MGKKLSDKILKIMDNNAGEYKRAVDYPYVKEVIVEVKALEAELQRLRDENADWMTKAQTEYILRMKADKKAELAESRLAEAEKILDRKYFGNRLNPDGRGLWRKPDFTSYDYENGDAKDTIDRIAKALRKDKEIEE